MSAVFRVGICRIPNTLLTLCNNDLKVLQRGIKGSILRCASPPQKKPAPWPYNNKRYTKLSSLFDRTSKRMDENSKIIVVEGSVASGKTKFAQELAADLGMHHMPEANLDMYHTNHYGFNFKKCDELLPVNVRSFDIKDFLMNPRHHHVAKFQIMQYQVRFSQYVDALAHLFSTGQGVVLERCAFSDFVFMEAMYKQGYVSKGARSVYFDIRQNTIQDLFRPHLLIYLDVNVDTILENVKRRNYCSETQNKVLNPTYLQTIEDTYKQNYLKEMSIYSELLVYDWSQGGDMEVIIEDIERLDFKRIDEHDKKFSDWSFEFEEDWGVARHKYSDCKDEIMEGFNIPRLDVPELLVEAEDCKAYYDVYYDSPGNKYLYGYNSAMGDRGIFFKLGVQNRITLPLIERKLD